MDTIQVKGTVHLKVYQSGKLIEDTIQNNLVVTLGKQALARLIGSADTDKRVVSIGFGTSGIPVAASQVMIENPFLKALDGVTYSGTSANFAFTLAEAENNGVTIREFALFCEDNEMFSRIVRNPISKTSDIRLEGVWGITF